MRTGATQSSPTALPDIRITIGADVFTSQDGGRLTRAILDEQVWGGQYTVELDNSDEALNAKDYKGSGATIYLGFIGVTGSNLPPLWVHNQQFISREGKLLLQLNCIDAWGLLAQVNADLASASYNQEWQQLTELDTRVLPDGKSLIPADIKTAIAANYNRTIFSILGDLINTIGKTVHLKDNDGIINVRKPAIAISNPISGIRRLLEMTKSYLLWKPDANGDFQVIQPELHTTIYSYNVADLFFSNVEDAAVTIPNQVNFYAWNEAMTGWIVGTANDAASQAKVGIIPRHILLGDLHTWAKSTTTELTALAEGHLAKIQGERSQGTLVAPMHCSQELFDKISIIDDRYTTPKTITGYVHRIVREYDRGVYRVTIQLGGVTSGYTPPGGTIPSPLAEAEPPARIPSLDIDWSAILPKAIQGFHTDITFTSASQVQVNWSNGTVKFYDGTTQAILEGNTGTLPDTTIRYIYFDLADASPNILKVTTNYVSVMTEKTGLLCLVQKGSAAGINATVIPSYGKQPLITPDVIHMTGLKEYTYPDGTSIVGLFKTDIQAGHYRLSATAQESGYRSVNDTEKGIWNNKPDDMDEIAMGVTFRKPLADQVTVSGYLNLNANTVKSGEWYNLSGVEIDAAHGINIYGQDMAFTTRATKTGTIQCKVDSAGAIVAGAGAVILDAEGIKISGQYLLFKYGGVTQGSIYATSDRLNLAGLIDIGGAAQNVILRGDEIKTWAGIVAQGAYYNTLYDIRPLNTSTWLGSSDERWARLYGVPILNRVGVSTEGAFKHKDSGAGKLSTYSDGAWRDNE